MVSPGPSRSFLQNCGGQGVTQERRVPGCRVGIGAREAGAGGWRRRQGAGGRGQGSWTRPNGTSGKVNADPDPGGKQPAPGPFPCLAEGQRRAGHPPSPHTCSARRPAPDTWSPASGSRARGRGSLPRPSPHPSPLAPPPGRGSVPGRSAAGSRRLFHPPTSAGMGRKFRFLQTDPGSPAASHSLYLSQLPRRRTDRRHKEKKLPPLLVPSSSPEPGGSRGGSTSSLRLPIPTR